MTVIGFAGYAGVGKDAAADVLVYELGYTKLSFAQALKEAVWILNPFVDGTKRLQDVVTDVTNDGQWRSAKDYIPEVRRLLQVFGSEVGRDVFGENVWVLKLLQNIDPTKDYVITDVRFPNEIAAVTGVLEGTVIRIERSEADFVRNHISETALDNFKFAETIINDGTKAQLREKVLHAVSRL